MIIGSQPINSSLLKKCPDCEDGWNIALKQEWKLLFNRMTNKSHVIRKLKSSIAQNGFPGEHVLFPEILSQDFKCCYRSRSWISISEFSKGEFIFFVDQIKLPDFHS
jgi:hypothetical protein